MLKIVLKNTSHEPMSFLVHFLWMFFLHAKRIFIYIEKFIVM